MSKRVIIFFGDKLQGSARTKEKKRQRRERQERIAAGEEVSEDDELVDIQPEKKKARRDGPYKTFNARVVVDLGFDDLMSEKVCS